MTSQLVMVVCAVVLFLSPNVSFSICGEGYTDCGQSASGNYGCEIGSYQGIYAYSNGGWTGNANGCGEWQCVDYVKRFYQFEVGNALSGLGDPGYASSGFQTWHTSDGLVQYVDGQSTVPPARGDIYCLTGNTAGHVGIITDVNLSTMQVVILDQNTHEYNGFHTKSLSIDGQGRYSIAPYSGYTTQGWLRDPGYAPAPTFIATQYGNATIAEPGPYYPGDIITCTIRFRNDGTATWHNTTGADKSYIELVSCNSSGQPPWVTSYFYDAGMGWLHDKVPCTMQESLREPGQVATFSFQGKIPLNTQLGQRSIYFGPVFNSHIMQGWNGNGFTITVVEPAPPPATGFTELVGKFTNDGYSDVCVYEPGNGKWWVAVNTAANNCFDRQSSTPWIDAFSTGSSYVALSGDIGGNDLDDIVTLDTVLGRWRVAYSTGSAFSFQPGPNQSAYWLDDWGKASVDKRYTPLLGDFNNDGFKEPLLYEAISGNWYVSLRDASLNRFNTTGVAWITGFGDGVGQYIPLTGNFVGDGKYDIALYHKSSGNWYVAENTGSAFVRCSPSLWITGFGDNGTYIPFAGQIRGDVYTDIGLFEPSTGNWFVAQSTGSAFTKLNGPEEYGAWITDYGNPSGYRPLFGYFSWDSYMDVGLYQPGMGSWFVAINDGNPDRFTRSDGVGDFDSWLSGWAKIQGSPKIVSDQTEALPQSYALAQNYPNPFNPVTRISFTLPQPSMTTLEVFNILGQKVTTLVHAKLPAGAHVYTWDAHQQASGIYLYRLQTEDAVETKKMLFLK